MANIMLLAGPDSLGLSGIPLLLRNNVTACLDCGASVYLALPKKDGLFNLPQASREDYSKSSGVLHVEWWPSHIFSHKSRVQLLFEIEAFAELNSIDTIFAYGLRSCAYVGSVAARQRQIRCYPILYYDDAFEHHLNTPQEIDFIVNHGDTVLVTNKYIRRHLQAFYPECNFQVVSVAPSLADGHLYESILAEGVNTGSDLVTTGMLTSLCNINELLECVAEAVHTNAINSWRHLGLAEPEVISRLPVHLAYYGLTNKFSLTGKLSRPAFLRELANAKTLYKCAGQVDTGLSVLEANQLSIASSVPPCYPVHSLIPSPWLERSHPSEYSFKSDLSESDPIPMTQIFQALSV